MWSYPMAHLKVFIEETNLIPSPGIFENIYGKKICGYLKVFIKAKYLIPSHVISFSDQIQPGDRMEEHIPKNQRIRQGKAFFIMT